MKEEEDVEEEVVAVMAVEEVFEGEEIVGASINNIYFLLFPYSCNHIC